MSRLPRLTPRKVPQQDRSRALVDAVLAAAKRVIVRDGISDARIIDIAELAGVSPGSLYQYFPNLASVVATLHVSLVEDSIADLTDNLLEHRDAPLSDVAAVIALVPLRNVRDDVDIHRVLALAAPRLGTERKLAPVFERERALLRSFFSSRSDLAHLPPESSAFVVTSAVRGCIDSALTETPSRIASPELELLLTGLVERYLAPTRA